MSGIPNHSLQSLITSNDTVRSIFIKTLFIQPNCNDSSCVLLIGQASSAYKKHGIHLHNFGAVTHRGRRTCLGVRSQPQTTESGIQGTAVLGLFCRYGGVYTLSTALLAVSSFANEVMRCDRFVCLFVRSFECVRNSPRQVSGKMCCWVDLA